MRDFEQVKADAAAKRTPEQQAEYEYWLKRIEGKLAEAFELHPEWIQDIK